VATPLAGAAGATLGAVIGASLAGDNRTKNTQETDFDKKAFLAGSPDPDKFRSEIENMMRY